jgi:hypothetical protein
MSEVTVPEALSGEEIKLLGKEQLGVQLNQECYLNDYLSYDAFEMEVTVKIKLHRSGQIMEVDREFRLADGSVEARQELKTQEWASSYVYMPEKPPNEVRQEAGLPIPTLTETASGRKEIRPVKYARRTEHEPEHEKKEHEHDPKKPGQGQPGQQQPGQPGQPPQQEPKR